MRTPHNLTLRIDLEEVKALHVPVAASTLTLPFTRSPRQWVCRAKDSPCQTCPRRGPSAWDANARRCTTQASPCAMCVEVNVTSKGQRSNCSHKKATRQLRKWSLASNYVPPWGGKLRNHYVSGCYQNMDPFSEEILVPYRCTTHN